MAVLRGILVAALAAALVSSLGVNGVVELAGGVASHLLALLSQGAAWALRTLRREGAIPGPHAPLLAAVRAVTSDQEELVILLHRFLNDGDVAPPGLEAAFTAALHAAAASHHAAVERALDWVIAIYKQLAPFILLYVIAAGMGGGGGDGGERRVTPTAPPAAPPPAAPLRAAPGTDIVLDAAAGGTLARRRSSKGGGGGVERTLSRRGASAAALAPAPPSPDAAAPGTPRLRALRRVFDACEPDASGAVSAEALAAALAPRDPAALPPALRAAMEARDGAAVQLSWGEFAAACAGGGA